MNKAFDTIERNTLIEDQKEILKSDELHLIKILLKDVEYRVRLEGKIGESFLTNIGSPQGDGASAILFIIYLAISLKKYKEISNNSYKCFTKGAKRIKYKLFFRSNIDSTRQRYLEKTDCWKTDCIVRQLIIFYGKAAK